MHESMGAVSVHPLILLAQILNFVLLLLALRFLLFKPLLAVVDKRREMIQKNLDDAAKSKDKAAELAQSYEAKIASAQSEAHDIIAQAEKQANERRDEIISDAHTEADRIKERAMKEIDLARHQALTQVRNEVSDISLLIAMKLLQESVDAATHQRLVDEFIVQLDRDKLGEAKC